ncbi:MAG: IclR family transcriptional regulator [Tistlia sp.]|uniref:IclR family transcriptional regulator n=1 Tax=Tistlia sp. TaxID=3057121 RepID=UPI0034A4E01A
MSEADELEVEISENERRRSVQSIKVGSTLLDALADSSGPLHLRELSKRARMQPSKARRYLISFLECGLVEQHPATGRYDLGSMALRLGFAALSRMDPVRLSVEAASALSQELDRTLLVCVWSERGPIIISWFDSSEILACNLRVGSVLPLTLSASGKLFLTHLSPKTTKPLVDRALRQAQTERRLTAAQAKEELAQSIRETRRDGFATSKGSLLPGLGAIAVPILDSSGAIVAAVAEIHKAGASEEVGGRLVQQRLVETAGEVSARLGYKWKAEA